VDCDLPRGRLVVVTGPSGSGKSSLAFDTLYAEGQRRYVESLSPQARAVLGVAEKPAVDSITGLLPAIAVHARSATAHPRSTVATLTEAHDHLRVLFAAFGQAHCPSCDRPLGAQTVEQMAERLLRFPEGSGLVVLAPVARARRGALRSEVAALVRQGFRKARVDGRVRDLGALTLDARRRHTVEVVVDRLAVSPAASRRLRAALERALSLGRETAVVVVEGAGERLLSRRLACLACDVSLAEPTPRSFSFNSPQGACPGCDGLGQRWDVEGARVVMDEDRSLLQGAVRSWPHPLSRTLRQALLSLGRRHDFAVDQPFRLLPPGARQAILEGDGAAFEGALPPLRRRLEAALRLAAEADGADAAARFDEVRPYLAAVPCPACRGGRLRKESAAVRLGGRSLPDYCRLTVREAEAALGALRLGEGERGAAAARLLAPVLDRLRFLDALGLGYLTLDRPVYTLSGGEAQRVRLAAQAGARLQGVLYVLDEPSVGLHPRDGQRLLAMLRHVRDLGNTVVVVEHDEETIRAADWVLDLGEGAGARGGRVLFQGEPAHFNGSLTGRYLRGELSIALPAARRPPRGSLRVLGAAENNLRGLDVELPLGVLTAVTGVSGSGKSTLVEDIVHRVLARALHGAAAEPGRHRGLLGWEALDKVVAVDQRPLGRTPRSNPATCTGAFALIRRLFSWLPEARARGWGAARFSFNVKGGRCEACRGDGRHVLRMRLLPPVYTTCPACRGRRYNRETLEVRYRGRSIADVLDMTAEDARALFSAHPALHRILDTLCAVGLGYLRLGQDAVTLSGGEAQRVKLARELSRRQTGRTLFLLDEPTTGLHLDDVRLLLGVLGRLVDAGNTVVVVEHHLDVIKSADHVIDLGPEGGAAGGQVVVAGTPEEVAACAESHTGRHLRAAIERRRGRGAEAPEAS
jgi:excinuclease ABC subunit A